jgi:hypothetical protein
MFWVFSAERFGPELGTLETYESSDGGQIL